MIDVRIHTTDPMHRDVINRYWALSSGRHFAEDVSAIESDHRLTCGQILSIVNSFSTVVSTVHRCIRCRRSKEFTRRKDLRNTRMQEPYVCESCRTHQGGSDESQESMTDASLTADHLRYGSHTLRTQVQRVTEVLSDVSDQLSTVSQELHGIRDSLEQRS